jgi:hypothetical protein
MTTGTQGSTARRNSVQMVHYLRFIVNYNDAGIGTGVGKQWLPAGAIIIGTDVNVITAFNAGTTNPLTVGIESTTYANIAAAASTVSGTTGLKQNISPTGTALVPLAADSQVFVMYAQTGTAATTGQAVVIVKYIPNNDL